jgi:hypothetical protein
MIKGKTGILKKEGQASCLLKKGVFEIFANTPGFFADKLFSEKKPFTR